MQGTCAAGHVTAATSDPGRITWEGPCATEGCGLKLKGRRTPGAAPAGDQVPAPTAAVNKRSEYRVKEVRPHARRIKGDALPDVLEPRNDPPATDPRIEPTPDPQDTPEPVGDPETPAPDEPRGRGFRRLRRVRTFEPPDGADGEGARLFPDGPY